MTTSEKILNLIQTAYAEQGAEQFQGLDTKTIASELGIWPNNTSVELNKLVREGSLRTEGTRPTRYYPAAMTKPQKNSPPAFENIIGYDGSLRQQLELARVAASYPPHGIHTLIIGETGVGKSLLAEEMWHYIQQRNADRTVPYVVFNCAEYADNPQLLLSQLFGYEKGAFTGAESSHAGLVEKADNGVLFLDELHRLPATGQELLFTLIDKKQFRRMGSTVDRTVNLMIIGATTENPDKSFLKTFTRRIPVLIQLPNLNERPIEERMNLISVFLSHEANRLGMVIRVSVKAFKLMASFECETNIGELRNEIQLCCARSFLLYITKPQTDENGISFIRITSRSLSRKMNTTISPDVSNYLDAYQIEEFTIYPAHEPDKFSSPISSVPLDFYRFVEDRMSIYSTAQHDSEEVAQLVAFDLEKKYYHSLYNSSDHKQEGESSIFSSVPPDIWAAANELIRLAAAEFNRTYSDNTLRTLAIYLNQTKSYAKANQVIFDSSISMGLEPNNAERQFVRKTMSILRSVLETELTDGEVGILAMLLSRSDQIMHTPFIGLVVCGYGKGTASGIAAFVNQILMTDIVFGIDFPLEQHLDISLQKLCSIIKRQDHGEGVVVLTDNNALISMESKIHKWIQTKCRILPWNNAMFTLEIAKAIHTHICDLDILVENTLLEYRAYQNSLFDQMAAYDKNLDSSCPVRRDVIITYCITGTGIACRARALLLKSSFIASAVQIIPMGIQDDIQSAVKKYGDRLKLIIGLFSPHISGIPFVSMESITSPDGINRVILLLQGWKVFSDETQWNRRNLSLNSRFEQISQRIQCFAPSLDAERVKQQVQQVIDRLTALYRQRMPDDVLVRVFIHTASMFERVTTSEPLSIPEQKIEIINQYQNFFDQLQKILEEACQQFGCSVPLSEVFFFLLTVPDPETMEEISFR